MHKKKSYLCSICNTSWECYIFDEFNLPFSICLYCYLDLENMVKKSSASMQVCVLCDTSKPCISLKVSNSVMTDKINVCRECFYKMKGLIERK